MAVGILKRKTRMQISFITVMCELVSWASSSKMLEIYKKTFSVPSVSGEYIAIITMKQIQRFVSVFRHII